MIYASVSCMRDPLKKDLAIGFCRKQNKNIHMLTENHISYDEINQIRDNWLGPIFLSPGDIHTKGLFLCFIWCHKKLKLPRMKTPQS